jgi:hypothetical protein
VTKRQKFIISSVLLTLGLLATQFVSLEYRYAAILGLFLVTFLVSAWALLDDLKGVEWLTILILPAMYSAGMSLFYFLLPSGWISRLIVFIFFGTGMYALLLTENIYSVAAVRTIQLVRAAHAVGFLMSILTLVLLFNTIYSFYLTYWANALFAFGVSLPIFIQALWSIQLKPYISKDVLIMSLGASWLLGGLALVLSFLPVTVWIASLFLATTAYVILGLFQHALNERLFQRTIYE